MYFTNNITITQRLPVLITIIFIIYVIKPTLIFKENGNIRLYGLGYDEEGYKKTLYTLHFIIIVFVFLLFVIIR